MSNEEILLVEDSPTDRDLALSALGDMASRTAAVRDGAEAQDFLCGVGKFAGRDLRTPIRLVLLDLFLPKVSGFEFLRVLKADPRTRSIPVVVFSSSRDERNVAESYRLGANSYVVKPLDASQFTAVICRTVHYWTGVNQPEMRHD